MAAKRPTPKAPVPKSSNGKESVTAKSMLTSAAPTKPAAKTAKGPAQVEPKKREVPPSFQAKADRTKSVVKIGDRFVSVPSQEVGYTTHNFVGHIESQINTMKERTGRTLEEWMEVVKKEGPEGFKKRTAWLLDTYPTLSKVSAWLIVENIETPVMVYDADKYVEELFSGPRAKWRPMYDRLWALAKKLGEDVNATPCKTLIPFRRKFVFAQVTVNNSRLDLGLALGSSFAGHARVEENPGAAAKKDRVTHRISMTKMEDIDTVVERLLRQAYDRGNTPGNA